MSGRNKITPEQWRTARERWERCDKTGFEWLVREMVAAFGMPIIRQTVSVRAARDGWEKNSGGGPSEPLQPAENVAQHLRLVAQQQGDVAQQRGLRKKRADALSEGTGKGEAPAPELASQVVSAVLDSAVSTRLRCTVGCPTQYDPSFVERILNHFDKQPFTDVEVPQPNGLCKSQRMATVPPMLADFAKTIGVSVDTLGRWANDVGGDGSLKHPDFAEAYARAREMQEALFAVGGALGLYESRFVQSIMKNLHGWQDQPARKVALAAISKDELERRYGDRMAASRARMQAVLEERADLLGSQDSPN